jgi:hypothetical protein
MAFGSIKLFLPMRPSTRAAARPAEVRSRIIARSNSAKAPTICIIIRPAGLVVLMFSGLRTKSTFPGQEVVASDVEDSAGEVDEAEVGDAGLVAA